MLKSLFGWPVAYHFFIFDPWNLINLKWNLLCVCKKAWRFPVGSPSVSLGQKQLCVWELNTRWKGFNKVVSLLLVLPFLSLPRFTNVWMPLMRNRDHSRGAQWSRSCDNLLFRCWLAVEMEAGSAWNCICLSVGLCGSYSTCGFHSDPIKENKLRGQPVEQTSALPVGLFFVFNILHLIIVKQDTIVSH